MIYKFRHNFSSFITAKVMKAVIFSLGSRYQEPTVRCRALKRICLLIGICQKKPLMLYQFTLAGYLYFCEKKRGPY